MLANSLEGSVGGGGVSSSMLEEDWLLALQVKDVFFG